MLYRTTGSVEPAPHGLFDEEYRLVTASGSEFHMWSEETGHLFSAIHNFQWQRGLIPLPELEIVTDWNTLKGTFDSGITSEVQDVERLIEALRILQENYSEFETAGKTHGFAALSPDDLSVLVKFLENAQACGETLTISEH